MWISVYGLDSRGVHPPPLPLTLLDAPAWCRHIRRTLERCCWLWWCFCRRRCRRRERLVWSPPGWSSSTSTAGEWPSPVRPAASSRRTPTEAAAGGGQPSSAGTTTPVNNNSVTADSSTARPGTDCMLTRFFVGSHQPVHGKTAGRDDVIVTSLAPGDRGMTSQRSRNLCNHGSNRIAMQHNAERS